MSDSTEEQGTTEEDVTTTEEMDSVERDRLMGQAYSAAQKDLRAAHRKEFDSYYQKQCAERGIQWTPKKSKKEAALDQITELLIAYPDLVEQLAERLSAELEKPTGE